MRITHVASQQDFFCLIRTSSGTASNQSVHLSLKLQPYPPVRCLDPPWHPPLAGGGPGALGCGGPWSAWAMHPHGSAGPAGWFTAKPYGNRACLGEIMVFGLL